MSYDIYLKDPVTGETAEVPGHLMIGGTYRAEYHPETRSFTPALSTEAHLNITYNYGSYYRESIGEEGIRTIYGLTGGESISILKRMVSFLEEKYRKDGEWIYTEREKIEYYDEDGNEIEMPILSIIKNQPYSEKRTIENRYEGGNSDYWKPTAANALKPLYQLIALARMRPDCIWSGD